MKSHLGAHRAVTRGGCHTSAHPVQKLNLVECKKANDYTDSTTKLLNIKQFNFTIKIELKLPVSQWYSSATA